MDISQTIAISILISIPILFSFLLLTRSLLKYPSFYIFQLLISSIALVLWTIMAIPIYLSPELLKYEEIVFLEHITTIIGAVGVIIMIYIIGGSLGSPLTIIPRFGIIFFSIVVGARLIQILLPNKDTIYGLNLSGSGNELIRVNTPLFQLIIIFSFVFLILTIFFFSKFQLRMPMGFVPEKIKLYTKISLILFSFGTFINFIGASISDIYFAGIFLLFSRIILTIGFMLIILIFTQNPILSFNEKGNPLQFINSGVIGWMMAGNRNFGPEELLSSEDFKKNYKISNLQIFSVKLISSVGMGGEEFTEEILVIPLKHKNYNLTSIGFSFQFNDPTLSDQRKQGKCELVYSLIIPTILLPYFGNLQLKAIKTPITKYFKNISDLETLLKTVPFDNLTSSVIRELTTKNFY